MSYGSILEIGPAELVAAALSLPLFSLVVASAVVAGTALVQRRRPAHGRVAPPTDAATNFATARYLAERRTLAWGGIAVIGVFAVENVVRGYLVSLPGVVEWWQYATPLFAALVGIAAVHGLILFRGTTPPEQPTVLASRRTWASFGPRVGLIGAGAAMLALLATTVAAGLASSADDQGRFIYLEIPVPNEPIDALRPWFYGWAYGVPVMVCLAGLAAFLFAMLHSNAIRPYLRADSVRAARAARAEVASAAVRIATAAALLSLAGAWRFIASAGSIAQLTISGDGQNDSYDTTWRYAEFALAAGWLAPFLEVTAFVLLLLVAAGLRRGRLGSQQTEHTADRESVR